MSSFTSGVNADALSLAITSLPRVPHLDERSDEADGDDDNESGPQEHVGVHLLHLLVMRSSGESTITRVPYVIRMRNPISCSAPDGLPADRSLELLEFNMSENLPTSDAALPGE